MVSNLALQILCDDERHHWILSGLISGEVRIYDSLSSTKFTSGMEKQLLQLYGAATSSNALLVTSMPVQQQRGVCDCGMFAIAFAVHTAAGQDVTSLALDQSKMRAHLVKCLEKKELSPFPQTRRASVKNTKLAHMAIPSYCNCGAPDSMDEMIQCDNCDKWWHFQCARIKDAPDNNWYCPKCIAS